MMAETYRQYGFPASQITAINLQKDVESDHEMGVQVIKLLEDTIKIWK